MRYEESEKALAAVLENGDCQRVTRPTAVMIYRLNNVGFVPLAGASHTINAMPDICMTSANFSEACTIDCEINDCNAENRFLRIMLRCRNTDTLTNCRK